MKIGGEGGDSIKEYRIYRRVSEVVLSGNRVAVLRRCLAPVTLVTGHRSPLSVGPRSYDTVYPFMDLAERRPKGKGDAPSKARVKRLGLDRANKFSKAGSAPETTILILWLYQIKCNKAAIRRWITDNYMSIKH